MAGPARPATYPVDRPGENPYVLEPRRVDGEEKQAVLLDSVPSQANRAEESLLRASCEGRLHIPAISIEHSAITLSSLEAPHRYADAYLRDSTIDGTPFDKSEIGAAMISATPAGGSC